MIHRNDQMLLRIAQGDAYGMAVEYIKFPRDQALHDESLKFRKYLKHPTHNLKPGEYTDDTQMSIGVTQVLMCFDMPQLLEGAFETVEKDLRFRFAESFVQCFKRDQRDGYARHFQAFLEGIADGTQFLERIKPDSDKNGAAMRSVPIGVLPNPAHVVRIAGTQAKITHDTVGGIQSSILVATMSHFALYTDDDFSAYPEWAARHCNVQPHDWPGGPVKAPNVGMNTADAVFTLLNTQKSLLDIARTAIEWGGDVDSVLAIAWGIASARMREELPAFFEGGLESGEYGSTYLKRLGNRLMDKFV